MAALEAPPDAHGHALLGKGAQPSAQSVQLGSGACCGSHAARAIKCAQDLCFFTASCHRCRLRSSHRSHQCHFCHRLLTGQTDHRHPAIRASIGQRWYALTSALAPKPNLLEPTSSELSLWASDVAPKPDTVDAGQSTRYIWWSVRSIARIVTRTFFIRPNSSI